MAIEFYGGKTTYVIWGEESSYGAGATVLQTNKIGKVKSTSLTMNQNFFRTKSIGDGANDTVAVPGIFDVSGSVDFDVDNFDVFKYSIGTASGAATSGSPYEIKELDRIGYDASVNTKTIQLQFGSEGDSNDDVLNVTGVVIPSFTINCTQGEPISATINWTGKTANSSTTLTAYTVSTAKPLVFQSGSVTIGTDTFSCMSFSLTKESTLSTYRNLGDRFIQQPDFGSRKYNFSLTFKKKFDDTASTLSGLELRGLFFGGVTTATTVSSSSTLASSSLSVTINEGNSITGDRVVAFELENVYFESWSEPVNLDDGFVECTVEGFGLAGKADGSDKVPIRYYVR